MKHYTSGLNMPLALPFGKAAKYSRAVFSNVLHVILLFLALGATTQLRAQCTPPVNSFFVNNQALTNIFPGGGSWPAGSTVVVTGTFTVDQSITLNNIIFLMNPNSRILVKGTGTTFSTTVPAPGSGNTSFHGCTTMWQGIQVTQGASVSFTAVDLEDALTGITFVNGANRSASRLVNCSFIDNLNGISIIGFSTVNRFSFASFNNNQIKRGNNGDLLPTPPGTVYNGKNANRGIVISNSNVDLAINAGMRNTIESHRYGMYCTNSTVMVANMTFNNNVNEPGYPSDTLDGTGIYAGLTSLVVTGAGTMNCQFFNQYNSGIISRNTRSLFVSGASFQSPKQYGIRCAQSIALSAPINILNNTFVMNSGVGAGDFGQTVDAIYVERPPSGPSNVNVLIKNNNISVSGGHQKKPMMMIDVQGKVEAYDITQIENNPINISVTFPRLSGIRVTGKGRHYNIIDNTALNWLPASNSPYPPSTVTSRAIIASDLMGSDHLINNNMISSKQNGVSSFLRAAIYLENNPLSTKVCSNTTLSILKGIECQKALGGTVLIKNNFGSAIYGLYCETNTIMPDQDRFENIWTAPGYAIRGAHYNGTPPFTIYYDPSNTITNDIPANTSYFPTNWFMPRSGTNAVCQNSRDTLTEKEMQIIGGSVPNATAADWDARRWLLYRLMNYPDLVASNPGAGDFLAASEAAATSPWKFARSEYLFDHAWLMSTAAQQAQMSTLTSQYQTITNDIAVLDQQMAQSATGYSPYIAQQLAYKFNDLTAKTDALEQQRSYAAPSVQAALQNAMTFVQALPEVKVFEDNLKDILVIAIREAQGDTIVENDFARLRDIAAQCPNTGGISVRRAPMWMLPEEGINYSDKDWDNGCGQPRPSSRNQDFQDTDGVQIMPNPANDMVHVVCPSNTSTWTVFDATGRIVSSGKTPEEGFDLSTAHWTSGLYFLSSKTSEGLVNTVKFSIIH